MASKAGFAVCFAGHRPDKLPRGAEYRMLMSLLYEEIRTAISDGADTFYTGMAQGVDMIAAQYVLLFRREYPVRLIAVRPFADHGSELRGTASYRYNTVLQRADEAVVLAPHYYRGCFFRRNQYMVEHSGRLIAVILDSRSGTGNTVRLAQRRALDIRLLTLPTVPPDR